MTYSPGDIRCHRRREGQRGVHEAGGRPPQDHEHGHRPEHPGQ